MSILRLPKHIRVALLVSLLVTIAQIHAQTQAAMNARRPLPSMSLIPSAPFTRLRAGYGAAGEIPPNDPTPDAGLSTCNHFLTWTFAAFSLLVATSAFAQEQEKPRARSVSPDGKWELRAGAAGEQDDFVIAKAGSSETSVVLSEEEYADGLAEALGRAPSYANIVWAPNSKRFAFNLQPGKAYQTAQFYQLDGDTWRKLDSLESNDATFAPLDRSMARQKKKLKLPREDSGWPIMTSWQVRRWIDPSTALLYAHSEKTFEIKNETESVVASFFFTLKFDPAGKWEIVRTREVPSKGVGGLNAQERKEINRIENEDRELRSK
jgi:hypothetical protein